MIPFKGMVAGVVSGVLLSCAVILIMLYSVVAFLLPYLIGIIVGGLFIFGAVYEALSFHSSKRRKVLNGNARKDRVRRRYW